MGRVFVGRSAGGRLVAVKVIRDELAEDRDFRVRFGREVSAAKSVSGMFTAPVVDADVDGPLPWLATAYVEGPSLADAVRAHGPLPVDTVKALAAGLAEGLAAIHSADLVHRDLKPSNVLLARDGPRVIDFGISRTAQHSSLTQVDLIVGSPGFMSPEQAEGAPVGPSSDVFSLGAVLVFAATGHGPFGAGADSAAALIYRVVHGQPHLDDVPAEIRPVIERCLAKDPGQRPTTAELLAEFGGTDLAAGWVPAPVIEGFAGPTASGPAAPAGDTAMSATISVVGQSAPPAVTPVRSAPGASNAPGGSGSSGAPAGPGARGGRRTSWGRRRSLLILAVAAFLAVPAVTAGVLAAGLGTRPGAAKPPLALASPTTASQQAVSVTSGTGSQASSASPSGQSTTTTRPVTTAPQQPSQGSSPSVPGNPGGGAASGGATVIIANEHLSGYSVYPKSGTLKSVHAAWHVPAVACPAAGQPRVVVWAGMWGAPASVQAGTAALSRAGTESLCNNGQVSYSAVWEEGSGILGTDEEAESFQSLPLTISPGDSVAATIEYLGSNSSGARELSLTLTDTSRGSTTAENVWTSAVPLANVAYQGGAIIEDHNQYGGLANFSQSPVAITDFTESGGSGGFAVFDYELIVNGQLLAQNSEPGGTLGPPPNSANLNITFLCNGCLGGYACPPPNCLRVPA